jgi:hypothetical protein
MLTVDKRKDPTIYQLLRQPLVRAELDEILNDLVYLTFDFSTAPIAHKVLE